MSKHFGRIYEKFNVSATLTRMKHNFSLSHTFRILMFSSSSLLGLGYTPEELSEAAVSVLCVQKSRRLSVKDTPLTGFYKRLEESVFPVETGPRNRKTSSKRKVSPPNIRIARVA
jgi:hypothetical protein